ncbi:unnamed protein product [Cylicocyclus nassatus]|uniref:KAP NTPase domain-containing protein n=1 Tax=Cylicocyclus nassatus TaxID=53992 RepID=A0AA36H442_CYLNA|nr:unnamed protein product [Cylicocyclus nassatus]
MTISSHVLQQPPGLIVVWVLVAAFSSCSYPLIRESYEFGRLFVVSIAFLTIFPMLISYADYSSSPLYCYDTAVLMSRENVDILADMIGSLDAFSRSQTRLVVVVDGLDNCGQERMV